MSDARWMHADGVDDHPVDPHYNSNGGGVRPFWTCHIKVNKTTCGRELCLDGDTVPTTVPAPPRARK